MMARIIIWSSFLLLPFFLFGQWSQPGDRWALEFDGTTTTRCTLANNSIFEAGPNEDVEVRFRFKGINTGGTTVFVSTRVTGAGVDEGGSNIPGWQITMNSSGYLGAAIDNGPSIISFTTTTTVIDDDAWHDIRFLFDRDGNMQGWVDGVSQGTTSISAYAAVDLDNSEELSFGGDSDDQSYPMDGIIENLKIYVDNSLRLYYKCNDGAGTTVENRLGGNDATIVGSGTSWYNKWTPPRQPNDISGLTIWLNADDVDGDGNIGNNTGDYSTWVDISGNGYNFTAGSGFEPTYVSSAVNGHAGLDFDGSVDAMTTGALSALNSINDYAIYVVAVADVDESSYLLTLHTNVSNNTASIQEVTGGSRSVRRNAATNVIQSLTHTNTDPFWCALYWEDASSYYVVNGSSTSVVNDSDPTISSHTNWYLAQASFGLRFDGKICEVIIYQGILSSADKTDVENYLTTKYGI